MMEIVKISSHLTKFRYPAEWIFVLNTKKKYYTKIRQRGVALSIFDP
jgi:hypothetical protein